MLEILLLFFLCKYIGDRLREKGRHPLGYQIGLVVLWFGAEIVTGIVSAIVLVIMNDGREPEIAWEVYAASFVAALMTAGAMILLVHLLPHKSDAGPMNPLQGPLPGSNEFGPRFGPQSKNPYQPRR